MILIRQVAVCVLAIVLCCCRSVVPDQTANQSVRLTVVNSQDTTMLLPGIELSYIAGDGSIHRLGETNQFGEISIPKGLLRSKSATVVLFCHRLFFCGAVRVREQLLLEYDEYLIALSPVVVR